MNQLSLLLFYIKPHIVILFLSPARSPMGPTHAGTPRHVLSSRAAAEHALHFKGICPKYPLLSLNLPPIHPPRMGEDSLLFPLFFSHRNEETIPFNTPKANKRQQNSDTRHSRTLVTLHTLRERLVCGYPTSHSPNVDRTSGLPDAFYLWV